MKTYISYMLLEIFDKDTNKWRLVDTISTERLEQEQERLNAIYESKELFIQSTFNGELEKLETSICEKTLLKDWENITDTINFLEILSSLRKDALQKRTHNKFVLLNNLSEDIGYKTTTFLLNGIFDYLGYIKDDEFIRLKHIMEKEFEHNRISRYFYQKIFHTASKLFDEKFKLYNQNENKLSEMRFLVALNNKSEEIIKENQIF